MKQFRFQFLAAAALLVLAACSSTDESADNQQTNAEPQAVSFGTYVNQSITRAGTTGDIGTVANLATAQGFGVFAYYTDNIEYSGTTIPNFMYNQQVTSTDAGNTWTYTPAKYWPNEYGSSASSNDIDKVSFFAYAPYVAVTPSTGQPTGDKTSGITQLSRNTATGDPVVKYIVNGSGSSVDLLWGVASSTVAGTATTPATTAGLPYLNLFRNDNAINFTFHHALAKLSGKIRTDATLTAAETKVYVRSITITGFASKGSLNLNNITANQPLWLNYDGSELTYEGLTFNDGRKDGREGTTDGAQANEKNQLLNAAIVQDAGSTTAGVVYATTAANGISLFTNDIYIIPSGGSETVDITIVYDVETKDDNLSTYLSDGTTHGSSVENCITKTAVLGAGTGFTAGQSYTLNLTLGMKKIEVSATISAWGAGSSADPNLPE